jgi:hypothetical protein
LKVEVTVELAKAEAYRLVGICHTQHQRLSSYASQEPVGSMKRRVHREAGRDERGEKRRDRIARTWAERRAETTLLEADRENMVEGMRGVGEREWRG